MVTLYIVCASDGVHPLLKSCVISVTVANIMVATTKSAQIEILVIGAWYVSCLDFEISTTFQSKLVLKSNHIK